MKLKRIFSLCLGLAAVGLTGCVDTLDGRHQAGVPWTKDRLEGRYEFTPAQLWVAAKDVLKHQGTLLSEDTQRNVLEASVDERTVWVAALAPRRSPATALLLGVDPRTLRVVRRIPVAA